MCNLKQPIREKMANQLPRYAIGIDLGGTKIGLGLVDESGAILAHQRIETHREEGAARIEQRMLSSIDALRKAVNVQLLGIGIGVAGQICRETGDVVFAPNLKWHNVPLRKNVEAALALPVFVMNDVRAITLGEWLYGAGRGVSDLLCVFVGTGIGCGVVSGGQLLTGATNAFGEVGHMTIDFQGPLCTCGKKGCWEAFAGGWGIAKRACEAIEANAWGLPSQTLLQLAGGNLEGVTAEIVANAYRKGDLMATELMDEVKAALIAGFASAVNIYNPSRLILGGGIFDGIPEWVQEVERGIKENSLKAVSQSLEVVRAEIKKEAGIIGSAAAVFNWVKT